MVHARARGFLWLAVSVLADQLCPELLPMLVHSPRLNSFTALALAQGGKLADYVDIQHYGWARAENAHDTPGGDWHPPEAEILGLAEREASLKQWLSGMLVDSGYSDHDADVTRLERPG